MLQKLDEKKKEEAESEDESHHGSAILISVTIILLSMLFMTAVFIFAYRKYRSRPPAYLNKGRKKSKITLKVKDLEPSSSDKKRVKKGTIFPDRSVEASYDSSIRDLLNKSENRPSAPEVEYGQDRDSIPRNMSPSKLQQYKFSGTKRNSTA